MKGIMGGKMKYKIIMIAICILFGSYLYCQNKYDPSETKKATVRILLGGNYLKPVINDNINRSIFDYSFGYNAEVNLVLPSGISVYFEYCYFSNDVPYSLAGYNRDITNETLGGGIKIKLLNSDVAPSISVGLSNNFISEKVSIYNLSKINRNKYMTEDLKFGADYIINKWLEMSGSIKLGLILDEFEIDRVNLNLSLGVNLFEF